jgi:hypothetical protein
MAKKPKTFHSAMKTLAKHVRAGMRDRVALTAKQKEALKRACASDEAEGQTRPADRDKRTAAATEKARPQRRSKKSGQSQGST